MDMRQERTIIGGLLLLQLMLWLGFLVHQSPRFPGSPTGGLLAVTAAVLMILPPLLYSTAKRFQSFREKIRKWVSLGTLLTWHVYSSIAGSMLAILHTGHHFESNVGIGLTTMMLLTVLSGFVGRYFLAYSSGELAEKQGLLNRLTFEYNRLVSQVAQQPDPARDYAATHGFVRRALNSFIGREDFATDVKAPFSYRAVRLAESIADLEYAIRTHEWAKRRAAGWLKIHMATSCAFYILLAFHVWSAIYFGLRWFK